MVEEFEDYLLTINSPELAAVYVDCAKVLIESGITGHIDDMTDLISTEDTMGRDQMINEIDSYFKNILESSINQFGIFLAEDYSIKYVTAMLMGINLLTNFDDREGIEVICLTNNSPEDKLFDLLEMVTEYTYLEYADQVVSVNSSFFTRLLETVSTEEDVLIEAMNSPVAHIILRVRSILYQIDQPWLLDEVDQGCKLGLSVDAMLERFSVRYEAELAADVTLQRNIDKTAAQYVSYILASNTTDGELLRVATERLDEVISHFATLQAVSRALPKYFSQVETK